MKLFLRATRVFAAALAAACPMVAALLAAPAVAQDQPLTVDMTEVYRVGGASAREEWAFFGPEPSLQASFDEAGELLVLDAANHRVVVIGPDGLVVHLERDEFDVPTLVVSRLREE